MIVKNPKLIPKTLIDLASYYKVKELRVYYKRPKWAKTKDYSYIRGRANNERRSVCLFLRNIMFNQKTHSQYWLELLEVFLHEVGHIRNPHPRISHKRYKNDNRTHEKIEERADDWCKKEITRLLRVSDTLFEPDYLGIFDIITNWIFKDKDCRYRYINEIRSRKIGRQYALSEVTQKVFNLYNHNTSFKEPEGLNEEQKEDWRETRDSLKKENRQYERAKRLVKRITDQRSMGKIYVDGAGRKHLFFSYGELEKLKEMRIIYEIVKCLKELWEIKGRLSTFKGILEDWKKRNFRLLPENIVLLALEKKVDFEDPRQLRLF